MKYRLFLIIIIGNLIFLTSTVLSQDDSLSIYKSDYLGYAASVYVDSLVITASRHQFDVEDFISLVVEDTSFHNAFRKLKKVPYDLSFNQTYFNKSDDTIAYHKLKVNHQVEGSCRKVNELEKVTKGNFYKRGKYRYYTSSLFDRIFLPNENCTKTNTQTDTRKDNKQSAIDYHIEVMKEIIFSPGKGLEMPLIGNKMALFSEEMQKYYQYTISSDVYNDSLECYVFDIKLKEKYKEDKRKTIVKSMTTYFNKEDLKIVSRDYKVAADQRLYDFDIDITVELIPYDDGNIPVMVRYDGYWKLFLKKKEKCTFEAFFYNFK